MGDQLIGGLDGHAQLPSVRNGLPALDELVGNSFGGSPSGRMISGASASGKMVMYPWSSVKTITLR